MLVGLSDRCSLVFNVEETGSNCSDRPDSLHPCCCDFAPKIFRKADAKHQAEGKAYATNDQPAQLN
jgi:hypothetical protein